MRSAAAAVAILVLLGLTACDVSSEPSASPTPSAAAQTRSSATVPAPPSAGAAREAPGAAVLGDDPTRSRAGEPVDAVDWITPDPRAPRTDPESPAECHQGKQSAQFVQCVLGDEDGTTTVMVAGDSKTRQWVPALDIAARTLGWRLLVSTKTTCAFTTAPTAEGGARSPYPSCDEWNREVIAAAKREKPDIFINALYKMRGLVEGDESRATTRERMIEGVRDAIGQVADTGADVIVLDSSPLLDTNVAECVAQHPDQLTTCTTAKKDALGAERTWDAASTRRVLSVAPQARLVDMNDYICPAERCAPVIGNVLVYRDKHHVTVPYMQTLAPALLARLEAAAATF